MPRPFPTRDSQTHNRANGHLLHDPCADFYGWEYRDHFSEPVEHLQFDGKSCRKLYAWHTPSDGKACQIQRTFSAGLEEISVISLKMYFVNGTAPHPFLNITLDNGTKLLDIVMRDGGIFIFNELLYDVFDFDAWHEWTFAINWTTGIITVYKDKTVIHTSSVPALYDSVENKNGQLRVQNYSNLTGNTTGNTTIYFDWIRIGNKIV